MGDTYRKHHALYRLMPALYRELDAAEGGLLEELLALIERQADVMRDDITGLWDDTFIETCGEWVIPYIGDLVANDLLYDASRVSVSRTADALFRDLTGPDLAPALPLRARADVAKTIYYRRRKGTVPMLEELARDVTGWPAHVREFFRILTWTQHLDHPRPQSGECVDLRDLEALDRLDGPFDPWSHTVDVRAPAQEEGWHGVPNVGFFLWRLGSYPMEHVAARRTSAPWRFTFSPLGNPAPLFNRARREGDEAGLAREIHVPGPIRRAFFARDLADHRARTPPPSRPDVTALYAPLDHDGSFHVTRNGVPIVPVQDPSAPPDLVQPELVCRRLDPWPAAPPGGRVVAIDVDSGRIAIGDGWPDATDSLDVSHHYGFAADVGGGPYERGEWLVDPALADLQLTVRQDAPPASGAFTTLGAALAEWAAQGRPDCSITILDNRTYAETLSFEMGDDAWLAIQAASGVRPHVLPDGGTVTVTGDHPTAMLTVNGLLVEGALAVSGELGRLRVLHSTLVPGRGRDEDGAPSGGAPSIEAAAFAGPARVNTDLEVQIAFSLVGPLRLPVHAEGLTVLDSLLDGLDGAAVAATGSAHEPGPAATLERATLLGASHFRELTLASECVFAAPVEATRRDAGCVRFSFVPHGSQTPRRYRCQPELGIATVLRREEETAGAPLPAARVQAVRDEIRHWLVPSFTARHYGLPGYGQLHLNCPRPIAAGAEDGSEMGVFSHLKQPQREANLRLRLDEYLPFGLVPGLIRTT